MNKYIKFDQTIPKKGFSSQISNKCTDTYRFIYCMFINLLTVVLKRRSLSNIHEACHHNTVGWKIKLN